MAIRNYIGLTLSIVSSCVLYWASSFKIEEILIGEILAVPGGKFKFLTILNLYLQIFYYGLCIINFFFGTNTIDLEKRSTLQKFRDFIFAGAAFPTATFVGLSYWSLYHFDRKLILPEEVEQLLPPYLDHGMHTIPAIAIWLENLVHYHLYPSRKSGLLCTLLISGAYTAWLHHLNYIHWLNSKTSLWVYPVLNELSAPYRILFFLGSTLFNVGLYLIGEMYTLFLTALRYDKAERNKKQN